MRVVKVKLKPIHIKNITSNTIDKITSNCYQRIDEQAAHLKVLHELIRECKNVSGSLIYQQLAWSHNIITLTAAEALLCHQSQSCPVQNIYNYLLDIYFKYSAVL